MGRWSNYSNYRPWYGVNGLFYWTMAINLDRYSRKGVSPYVGQGNYKLGNWWQISLLSSYLYWRLGAVFLIFCMLGWLCFHLIWLTIPAIDAQWLMIVLILSVISTLLACIILGASYFIVFQNPDVKKLFTCGFDPYEDGRNCFDVKFYLIALLFIIFDLETMFLFPWTVSLGQLNLISFYSMLDFFFELLIGFFYIWILGVLDWS